MAIAHADFAFAIATMHSRPCIRDRPFVIAQTHTRKRPRLPASGFTERSRTSASNRSAAPFTRTADDG
ncbi:hypothetical protein WS86_26805 [Burkholderia savannae]|nr:hypothetical protein WS86_26805 [Burkholderia savannae]